MSAAAALRANVRLLGNTLGMVLVEQEGRWLLDLVERVRTLSLAGRSGDEEAAQRLSELIAGLSLEQQSLILRAFGMYSQLANIAEQHHRVRRRRQYEHEGHTPQDTLA